MAIQVACHLYVARKSEIESKYPGGLGRFRGEQVWPHPKWLEDQYLAARSSMAYADEDLPGALTAAGISLETPGNPGNAWLDSGSLDGVGACWLRGSEPGTLIYFFLPPNPAPDALKPSQSIRRWWQIWR